MPPDPDFGQLFDALVDQVDGRRGRSCVLRAIALIVPFALGILATLPAADA